MHLSPTKSQILFAWPFSTSGVCFAVYLITGFIPSPPCLVPPFGTQAAQVFSPRYLTPNSTNTTSQTANDPQKSSGALTCFGGVSTSTNPLIKYPWSNGGDRSSPCGVLRNCTSIMTCKNALLHCSKIISVHIPSQPTWKKQSVCQSSLRFSLPLQSNHHTQTHTHLHTVSGADSTCSSSFTS